MQARRRKKKKCEKHRSREKENFSSHAVCLILTAHAQVLENSQRCGDDSVILCVQSVLDGNYYLRNDGQDFSTVSIQQIMNSIARDDVVRKFRFT